MADKTISDLANYVSEVENEVKKTNKLLTDGAKVQIKTADAVEEQVRPIKEMVPLAEEQVQETKEVKKELTKAEQATKSREDKKKIRDNAWNSCNNEEFKALRKSWQVNPTSKTRQYKHSNI